MLERIAARLGPQRVLRPVTTEDHRPEWMCHWQPAPAQRPRRVARPLDHPQPTFILPQPLRLALRDSRPLYQGPLAAAGRSASHRVRLVGPGRRAVRRDPGPFRPRANTHRQVARDYWVALSEHAGVLWIFQTRLADERSAWFLHGIFA